MRRFALKTFTYALMHFVVAIAVAYALTRDWRLALAVGIIEPMAQTVAFALHERLWSRKDRAESPSDSAAVCSHTALARALSPDRPAD